jgi:hypothetical protein
MRWALCRQDGSLRSGSLIFLFINGSIDGTVQPKSRGHNGKGEAAVRKKVEEVEEEKNTNKTVEMRKAEREKRMK